MIVERRELAGDPRPIPVEKGSVETTASATGIDTDVARLFDAYAAKLLRYCACRVGPDAAEDLVASTLPRGGLPPRRVRPDPG